MKKTYLSKLTTIFTASITSSFLLISSASADNKSNNDTKQHDNIIMHAVKKIENTYKKITNKNAEPIISGIEFNEIVDQGVSPIALDLALKAYQWADNHNKLQNKRYLTIVNFDKPSSKKRMHVIDLKTGEVVFNELVSQGRGSGAGLMAKKFSDRNGSHQSVLGAIITSHTYYGKHGYSLRLDGIEKINDRVRSRAIVVHPANYATQDFVNNYGRLGTSWGCFAISPNISKDVINVIKDGSLLFSYSAKLNDENINYA